MFPGMDPGEVVVGSRARLQHGAALLTESSGDRFERFSALGALWVPCRSDVIDETGRADENHRHGYRLVHVAVDIS